MSQQHNKEKVPSYEGTKGSIWNAEECTDVLLQTQRQSQTRILQNDTSMTNKQVHGNQLTIVWHVDD